MGSLPKSPDQGSPYRRSIIGQLSRADEADLAGVSVAMRLALLSRHACEGSWLKTRIL
jgi:hypothetical protein